MSVLLVVADDAGLDPRIDEGILATLDAGLVRDVSVCANGRNTMAMRESLRARGIAVGVHLVAVEERPLLPPEQIPSLVERDGNLHQDWRAFAARRLTGRLRLGELELEWRAQIRAVRDAGLRVTHLNSHQHVHMLPRVFELALNLAKEFGIGWIRTVNDRGGRISPVRRGAIAVAGALGRRHGALARGAGVSTSDLTIGVAEAGHLHESALERLIASASGVTELVCHPGGEVPGLVYPHWNYDWALERDALRSENLFRRIASAGLEVRSIGELTGQRAGIA